MEMNMDLPLADRNLANSMEMAIMESDLDSGYYELITDGGPELQLQGVINNIDIFDMDGQLLPAYEFSGAENGGLVIKLEPLVLLVEQTPKIETWTTDAITGPGPLDLPASCFSTPAPTVDGDYNLGEESRITTAAVSHCPQSQLQNALPLLLEPNQLAGPGTPPAPNVIPAIIEEKSQTSSREEAATDFNDELVDQLEPSTADQYLIEASENEGHHTSEVPQHVRVPPTNIRVVVKNKEEFMESAMKCGINPAELKVNYKLTRKCPGRTRSLKRFVPPEEVTPEYLAKRAKNTESARRSRDSKRVRENELILRTVFLEEKYVQLKARYEELLKLKATKLEARAARISVQN